MRHRQRSSGMIGPGGGVQISSPKSLILQGMERDSAMREPMGREPERSGDGLAIGDRTAKRAAKTTGYFATCWSPGRRASVTPATRAREHGGLPSSSDRS
jgi:hypothetical protein